MRMVAAVALTAGVLLLLLVVYLLVWTGHRTSAAQADLRTSFHAATTSGKTAGSGGGVAILTVPALGARWQWVVVEGTTDAALALGPGHFTGTALPGQIGNFAVAGHRATHGQPFAHLDKVHQGDRIYVETAEGWFTYEVTWNRIVAADTTSIVAPVAGHPETTATQSTLTLVTCHPRWGSAERLVVGARLIEKRDAAAGPPAGVRG